MIDNIPDEYKNDPLAPYNQDIVNDPLDTIEGLIDDDILDDIDD